MGAVPALPTAQEPALAPHPSVQQSAELRPARLDVTVVLPCFNEEPHLLQELERITAALDASDYTYELLAIDDASTDGTRAVLERAVARFPHLRFMPFQRNGGSGTARRIGTREARGEIVVWTDADMTYPNERIPELVAHLVKHPQVDQVVGARRTEQGTHRLLRVPAKWLIRKIAEQLASTPIPDLNSGLRAFRRSVSLPYLRLLPPGFSCVTTLTLSFLSNQHAVDYVPIDYAKRSGKSKFHPLRDAYRYILQVLRMVMYFNPLKVLMPLALWLFGIGMVKAIVDLVLAPRYIPVNTVLLLLTGLIIGSLALLADLIVRSRDI
jgi:glycosyltransferase involved in cell wall biosynthesis